MIMQLKKIGLFLCFGLLATSIFANDKTVYGLYEKVTIMDLNGLVVPAKLDTGAVTASLSAVDIELFNKKDGKQWVRFSPFINDKKLAMVELPVVRITKIKRRASDICIGDDDEEEAKAGETSVERPVVDMQLCLGGVVKTVRINLTDRSGFNYPLLIGSSALKKFDAVVDPSLKYQSKATCTLSK